MENVVFLCIVVIGLWWLWQGIMGVWYLVNYLAYKGFWENTCLIVVLGLLFGWNIITGTVVVLICLGPITKAFVESLLVRELR